MNVLRFRRDRRQRDPFAAAPVAVPEAPARTPEWPPPAYESRMDVDATFARLVTEANVAAEAIRQQEAERERLRPPGTFADPRAHNAPWGPWDQPGSFPDALNGEALSDEHGRWYGWDTTVMDCPPVHTRPYAPDALTAPAARAPLSFRADFAQLPAFRGACRAAGHAPAGRVRGAGFPPPPDFRIGEMMHARFAGMLAMRVTERAA